MAEVKVYTTDYCPYCKKAKALLTALQIPYEEIDVTHDAALRDKLVEMSEGRTTVPQIFIDGKPIGGFTDLERLHLTGNLDILLEGKKA